MSNSCDPVDCSLPGSCVPGILQSRILHLVAISFSKESCWPGNQTGLSSPSLQADSWPTELQGKPKSERCSVVSHSATPWTVVHQAPLSMEFSRQEYWNGLPFPSPGDLPDPGIKPMFPESPALADGFFLCHLGSPYIL